MDGVRRSRLEGVREVALGLRRENRELNGKLDALRAALLQARRRITTLEAEVAEARRQAARAQGRFEELQALHAASLAPGAPSAAPGDPAAGPGAASAAPAAPPAFVKANVPAGDRRPPGRAKGHRAAHRPMPAAIDVHVQVPVPRDPQGHASCPACHTQLSDLAQHERVVEDLVPAQRVVTCYHTTSGYCPSCRKRIESRDAQQPPSPPGVSVHQPQLGINALATAALLRLQYRLPFRQVVSLLADLPGLSLSAGAVARQLQRMAHWLRGEYDRIKVLVRASRAVHMDETGWRINGQNHWLWTMHTRGQTAYHMDKSRGQKVVRQMLGDTFNGTLISDFYSAYNGLECPKQKCLTHLLRELKETAEAHETFAKGAFYLRARRLAHLMLALKKKKGKLAARRYDGKVDRLERRVRELGRGPAGGWKEPQAQRISKLIRRHGKELTTFLRDDAVDPTNNAAERALRPAVVARKISGGSRSAAGADATAILLSVLRTATQQRLPLLDTFKTLLTAHWAGKNPGLLTDLLAEAS